MHDLDLTLARALVAVPGFRVMDGSLWRTQDGTPRRVITGGPDFAVMYFEANNFLRAKYDEARQKAMWRHGDPLPVLDDPATAGCLAELLGPCYHTGPGIGALDNYQTWHERTPDCVHSGATRGEAIARAIVAAGRCAGGEA